MRACYRVGKTRVFLLYIYGSVYIQQFGSSKLQTHLLPSKIGTFILFGCALFSTKSNLAFPCNLSLQEDMRGRLTLDLFSTLLLNLQLSVVKFYIKMVHWWRRQANFLILEYFFRKFIKFFQFQSLKYNSPIVRIGFTFFSSFLTSLFFVVAVLGWTSEPPI